MIKTSHKTIILWAILLSPNLLFSQLPIQQFWALNQCNLIISKMPVKPAAAYSLRKLNCNYTGYAIRVRRSNDNTTQDIGFLANGNLNTAALLTFCGTNSGYVSIWYDQSGNGKNIVQTTNSQQPQIVNGGAIIQQNNLPSIYFLSTNNAQLKYTNATAIGNAAHTLNSVARSDDGSGTFIAYSTANSSNQNSCLGSGNNSTSNYGGIWIGGYGQDGTYVFGTVITALAVRTKTYATTPQQSGFINQTAAGNVATTAYNLTNSNILVGVQDDNSDNRLTGYVSEVFLFTSALSDPIRLILERDQKRYWRTP